ncbi:MAG: hypothetical protein LBJ22_01315, partial [Synergistaceae bacterium]|nr:hypothetical protein [Synergistaceae bacterium]
MKTEFEVPAAEDSQDRASNREMKFFSVKGAKFSSVCACVPENTIDNMTSGAELFGADIENAIKATGVRTRRVCPPGVTALDLSVA